MKKELVAAGFVFFSFMLPLKASAAGFTKFYVFGDSLSDTGNLFTATGGLAPNSFDYPGDPVRGKGRFSNGLVWVDYLGDKLGLQPTLFTNLSPTVPPTQGINFAFGGATTGEGNAVIPDPRLPGISKQVELFTDLLKATNQKADPNALYAVWGGANDFIFPNPENPIPSASNISKVLGLLAQAGAKNILVFNLPNLGKIPFAQSHSLNDSLSNATIAFNSSLATTIATLKKNPNLNIIPFDSNSLFNQVIASPSQFGFTNVTEPCHLPTTTVFCANPNEHLFWDDVHPTTVAHKLIADQVLLTIKSKQIPEPSTNIGMLALGALGAAAMLKRQQQKFKLTLTNRVLDAQSSHIKVES